MAILVTCAACATKYSLADTLAGKRIRCKKCGGVIAVPAAATAPAAPLRPAPAPARPMRKPEAPALSDEPDLSSVADDEDSSPPAAAPTIARPSPSRRPGPPPRMIGDVIVEGPEDDEDDSSNPPAAAALAPNRPFAFPGSRFLDTTAAHIIAAVALIWMIVQTFSTDTGGPPWVVHLRWCLYLAAYALIVYPLTLVGVHISGRKMHFGMPPAHYWKIFAIFSLPFMLGVILALIGGSLVNFVTGTVVGLAAGLAVFVFLYRLRSTQAGTALSIVAAFFLGGVSIVALLGYGINAAMRASMRKEQTIQNFAKSPLGAFPWDDPPPARAKPPKHSTFAMAGGDNSTSQPATSQASTQPGEIPATQSTTRPEVVVIGPDRTGPSTMPPTPTPPGPTSIPATIPANPASRPAPEPPATQAVVASSSPFVASISNDVPIGEFDDASYPGLSGSNLILVVRSRGALQDAVELWNTQPFEKKSSIAPAHPANEKPVYWLAPKAATYARLIDFPRKGIEIRSTADDNPLRTIDLDTAKLGTPGIAGFAVNNQIIVLWEQAGQFALEAIDTTTGQRIRAINLPGFQKGRGNLAISPDGKFIAAAVKAVAPVIGRPPAGTAAPEPSPAIQLSDVSAGVRPPKILPISAVGEKQAPDFAAMLFSADSARLSLLYAAGGNYLIVTWKLPEPKPISETTLFSTRPADAAPYPGPILDELPGKSHWLLYGTSISESNQIVGDLGIPGVRGHHIVDRETLAVTVPSESGKLRMVMVKLNAEKFTKPATRPR